MASTTITDCPAKVDSLHLPLNNPCLICGQFLGVKEELEDDFERGCSFDGSSLEVDNNASFFQYFFKLFGVKPEMWMVRTASLGRGEEVEIEQVPFCNLCKHRLQLLLDLHHKLEKLKEQHRIGKEEMKKLLEVSEESLQRQDIYRRDKRYLGIRRKILGSKRVVVPVSVDVLVHESRRSSSSRLAALNAKEKLNCNYPIVMVSSADRTRADTFLKHEYSSSETLDVDVDENSSLIPGFSNLDDMEVEFDNISNAASSDPDYAAVPEPKPKKKIKSTSEKRRSRNKLNPKTTPKHGRASRGCPNLNRPIRNKIISSSKAESSEDDSFQEPRPDSSGNDPDEKPIVQKVKIKSDKEDDVDNFFPLEDDNGSMPNDNEESPKNDRKVSKRVKKKKINHNRLRTDNVTGDLSLLKVTLKKLPNNDLGKEQYKCMKCSEIVVVTARSSVRDHVHGMHANKYRCNQCIMGFSSQLRLDQHLQAHEKNRGRIYPCKICGKPFSSRCSEQQHRKTHQSVEEKEEKNCQARARSNSTNNPKIDCFKCVECGQTMKTKNNLEYHRKSQHGSEEEKASLLHLCQVCGKYVNYLESHMRRMHATEKSYQCPLCDERFHILRQLRRHNYSVHIKSGPFKCTMCPKTFFEKKQLDHHLKFHLNIRPFQCEHCPNAFIQAHHLQRHIKIYHEEGSRRGTCVRGPKKKDVFIPPASNDN